MPTVAGLVTLLTDFGLADYYVGAVKGTLLRLAPGCRLIDLSHELPPGDVAGAADLLAGAAPTFPPGTIHLAVVDPGVGGDRRILAARAGVQSFVAPDNGLLGPSLERLGGADARVWSVERGELFLSAPGATFHGRDRFAPVAAALACGEAPESLGPEIDDPVPLPGAPPTRRLDGGRTVLVGRVGRIDRFGNLVTDLPAAWVAELEPEDGLGPRPAPETAPAVEVAGHEVRRWVSHYAELAPDEAGALVGSLGTVELSLPGESLARRWGIERGAPVLIRGPEG